MNNEKIKIGITIGDYNGIGLEVALKALAAETLMDYIIPVIYGSSKVVSYHKNIVKDKNFHFQNLRTAHRLNPERINVVNCWQDTVNITLGRPTEESGRCAHIALDRAIQDLREGLIDLMVTAPINKEAMQMTNFPYTGHTDYLGAEFDGSPLMMLVSRVMKVALVTTHVPLADVAGMITKDLVAKRIQQLSDGMKLDFDYEKPVIAVLGLNPHAGESGLLGEQEENIIRPAIIEAKKKGEIIMGPFPADGFFGSGQYRKFDGILAMYHDQGLIPFKTLSFHDGVNATVGLRYVRTSPDHGTAYELAGLNEADHQSMQQAIYTAVDMYRNRKSVKGEEKDSQEKEPKPSEEEKM